MPRYFFEPIEVGILTQDLDGFQLHDDEAAQRMAWSCLSDIVADKSETPAGTIVVIVRNEERSPIYEIFAAGSYSGPMH